MRLLFVNRYFYPDFSATSQLLTELAEDLDAKGDSVTVITGNTSYVGGEARLPAHEMYKGIRIVRVGFTRFGRSQLLGRLFDYSSFWVCAFRAAIRTKHQDCLVVISDPPLLSVFAALVRMIKPVKTVCWLQDVFPEIAIRAALTGGIASGKSYVLARIASRNIPTVDADALVHEALAAGSPAVARVAARFGRAVLADDGSIDRKALGQLVFADPRSRTDLESLLHPEVFRRINQWFGALVGAPESREAVPFAVADIPLLFETRHEGLFDRVIVTICSPGRQLERMMLRDGLTREEAGRRLHAQWPIEDKARLAHYVIDTNGTFEESDTQVNRVLADLAEDARRSEGGGREA